MDLTGGLAAIKGITAGIESVNGLLTAIKDAAHHEQLVKLKEALLTAKEEALALREEVMELRTRLSTRASLAYDKAVDAYFREEDGKPKDGPFCKTCWDKDSKLLRLDREGWCAGCKNGYGPDKSSGGWSPSSSY